MTNPFNEMTPDFTKILNRWNELGEDSRIQLMSSIKEAKEEDNSFELILTLNIFFEALVTSWLKQEDNLEVGNDYYNSLKNAKNGGLLNQKQYDLLDELRDSRNDYAHDVEAHHSDYKSPVEENGNLDEIYRFWASLPVNAASDIEVDNNRID